MVFVQFLKWIVTIFKDTNFDVTVPSAFWSELTHIVNFIGYFIPLDTVTSLIKFNVGIMLINILKSFFLTFWILVKPFIYILIPLIIIFIISFWVAHYKKKKKGTAKREVIAHVNPKTDVSLFTKLFIQIPFQYWENYYNQKLGTFTQHGIVMYTGKQGQGKTLAMTRDILNLQYRFPSLKVCTNYGFNYEDEQLDDWKKLVDYNNGEYGVLAAIDECQNWFSSKISKDFPPRMLATVTQNRKNRRVIFMTSHFFTNVSKPIRLHCTEVRQCRTFLKCFTIVKRSEPIMNGDGDVIKMKKIGYYCFVHNDKLYNSYDTYKVIKNLSEAGFTSDNWVDGYSDFNPSSAPLSKRKSRMKNRSIVAENTVNNAIDSVFNIMNNNNDVNF